MSLFFLALLTVIIGVIIHGHKNSGSTNTRAVCTMLRQERIYKMKAIKTFITLLYNFLSKKFKIKELNICLQRLSLNFLLLHNLFKSYLFPRRNGLSKGFFRNGVGKRKVMNSLYSSSSGQCFSHNFHSMTKD